MSISCSVFCTSSYYVDLGRFLSISIYEYIHLEAFSKFPTSLYQQVTNSSTTLLNTSFKSPSFVHRRNLCKMTRLSTPSLNSWTFLYSPSFNTKHDVRNRIFHIYVPTESADQQRFVTSCVLSDSEMVIFLISVVFFRYSFGKHNYVCNLLVNDQRYFQELLFSFVQPFIDWSKSEFRQHSSCFSQSLRSTDYAPPIEHEVQNVRRIVYSMITRANSEKNPSASNRSRTYDLPITWSTREESESPVA